MGWQVPETPPPDYRLILATRPPGVLRPGEKKRAASSLARLVRDFADGTGPERLVEIVYGIALDDLQPTPVRLAAIQMLFDRGFGKPAQLVHVEQSLAEPGAGDRELQRLDDRALAEVAALGQRVRVLMEAGGEDVGDEP